MNGYKILLVEDEKKIAGSLCQGLSELHYEVDIACDGLMGKRLFQQNSYDLAILDINLPLLNGFELCKHIRSHNEKILVIMLTAMNSVEDKLSGFQAGADDYLAKPFDFKELLARIQALLKRLQKHGPTGNILKVADLIMHLDSMEVTRNNRSISLTAKEFQLLEYFIRNKNKVLSRSDIAIDVWEIDFDTKTNVIDVYVNFLRKKIDKDYSPKLIHTYVGVGYTLKEAQER
jgi:two-component system, OmpR family, copper resistance phosphate regulon response regulator CusR